MSALAHTGRGVRRPILPALIVAVALVGAVPAGAAAAGKAFASPEQAVEALVTAARNGATARLLEVLGPGAGKLVNSGDPIADRNARQHFAEAYDREHRIEREGPAHATLFLGPDRWPFPIPLVERDGGWRFDTTAGENEILDRRIGRNELNAIQVCHAYVDAQREYAAKDRNADGLREYARQFLSHPGKHDGLYWEAAPGEEASPMGPLVASARAEGYPARRGGKRTPYHGYYYRILTAQGPDAPGGAFGYLAEDRMIGGFALVAFPAQYGVSGVMTFIVNQDGVVYERDLGPDTTQIARSMKAYDPGPGWKKP